MDEYDYLYHDPKEMDGWRWFLEKEEWVREIKDGKEAEGLVGKRTEVEAQWVCTHSGETYDTVQLEIRMPLGDGSTLYGALGNPNCDLDGRIYFPPCLHIPAQNVKEGEDGWLPFGIEVACIVGRAY